MNKGVVLEFNKNNSFFLSDIFNKPTELLTHINETLAKCQTFTKHIMYVADCSLNTATKELSVQDMFKYQNSNKSITKLNT